jgi:hypothetical protein
LDLYQLDLDKSDKGRSIGLEPVESRYPEEGALGGAIQNGGEDRTLQGWGAGNPAREAIRKKILTSLNIGA